MAAAVDSSRLFCYTDMPVFGEWEVALTVWQSLVVESILCPDREKKLL